MEPILSFINRINKKKHCFVLKLIDLFNFFLTKMCLIIITHLRNINSALTEALNF